MSSSPDDPVVNVSNDDDNDDDDDDAELFSFGSSDAAAAAVVDTVPHALSRAASTDSADQHSEASSSGGGVLFSNNSGNNAESRRHSSDSILELMQEDNSTTPAMSSPRDLLDLEVDHLLGGNTQDDDNDYNDDGVLLANVEYDQETQDMLDWLDDDDAKTKTKQQSAASANQSSIDTNNNKEKTTTPDEENRDAAATPLDNEKPQNGSSVGSSSSTTEPMESSQTTTTTRANSDNTTNSNTESATTPTPLSVEPTVVALPPTFDTLPQALSSDQATLSQIKALAQKTPLTQLDDATIRPDLFCRLLHSNKTCQQTQTSSLADSFLSWTVPTEDLASWIPKAAQWCNQHMLSLPINNATHPPISEQDLVRLLAYYNSTRPRNNNNTTTSSSTEAQQQQQQQEEEAGKHEEPMDVLIPCVASVLLAAGIPLAAASVILTQIQAHCMPLTALQPDERWEAAQSLHHALYLLAAYHLPLLVVHLDRYWPGWFGPRIQRDPEQQEQQQQNQQHKNATARARHMDQQGQIPPSWLLSFLSGQVYSQNLPMAKILRLWDAQLTQNMAPNNNLLRFFLTLAVLERAADDLILVTGDALTQQLQQAFLLENCNETEDGQDWFEEWMPAAQALFQATPVTVLKQLQTAEDQAVQSALEARQARAEAALQARLQAEAAAHQQAQELKAEQARQRLTRARLVAYYRKHAPDKETNIDKILSNYAGRYEVLDAKLFKKYGESFNPALAPAKAGDNNNNNTKKQSNTVGGILGLGRKRAQVNVDETEEDAAIVRKPDQVSVLVEASEVLPIVCWAKGGSPPAPKSEFHTRVPLKYFLVDSRSEEAAAEQGRFPTAVALSPEAMMDPERVLQLEDKFEALRGAVHICIMGEGFSAIPTLYQQKLSSNLEAAMVQDESRTNICALFFIKKGFPFVSVLDGGFAAAHAWLVREGPQHSMQASSVLVDYDPTASVFGQMETLHNESMTEKASRQLNNLVENSLVAMTLQAQRLEQMAVDMESNKQQKGGGGGLRLGAFFKGSAQVSSTHSNNSSKANNPKSPPREEKETPGDDKNTDEKTSGPNTPQSGFRKNLRNPFARNKSQSDDESGSERASDRSRSVTPPRKVPVEPSVESEKVQFPQSPPVEDKAAPVSPEPNEASATSNASNGPGFLKRNPFRGFGGGAGKVAGNRSQHGANRSSHGATAKPNPPGHSRNKSASSGGFASFNNLRKSALGRIRSAPNSDNKSQQHQQLTTSEEDEESISFD